MKINLYYRTVFRRENMLRARVLDFFLTIASYPRMLIEVFIRKNFGERYFSWATALTLAVLLLLYPVIITSLSSFFAHPFSAAMPSNSYPGLGGGLGSLPGQTNPFGMSPGQSNPFGTSAYGQNAGKTDSQYLKYITWYIFTLAFLAFSFFRYKEVQRNPSVFDFAKFSLYTGDIHPFFSTSAYFKNENIRSIEIFYEPLPFFVLGCILTLAGQSLGGLLIFSSICYCLSYAGAYERGDHFTMDKIDEMILNEEMEAAFIHDEPADKTRGVRFYTKKPSSEKFRRKVEETFFEDDDEDISVAT